MESELQEMIDEHGIKAVLNALGNVCANRAQHFHTDWQDDAAASVWQALADGFRQLSSDTIINL